MKSKGRRGGNRERIVEHADKIEEKNQRTKTEKNASQQRAEAPAWWILNNDIAGVRRVQWNGKNEKQ